MERQTETGEGPARVAATHPVADDLLIDVSRVLDVTRFDTAGWSEADFIDSLRGYAGLLISMRTPMNSRVLQALAPELRVISSFTAGVENIDLNAADRLGIAVANTASMVAVPTAEITMLLMLAAMRRARPSLELIRSGQWRGVWGHAPAGAELDRKTLGIVGMGGIGSQVAKRAAAFGMSLIYHNRNPVPVERTRGAHYFDTLETLLGQSDVVTLHCPLTEQTREMINADTLAHVKPGAVLINTARGELLREDDVIAALESGRLGAVGLDVYAGEPAVNSYFLSSDKVFTLPHIGTATPESRRAMAKHALHNLARYFSGEPLQDEVVAGQ